MRTAEIARLIKVGDRAGAEELVAMLRRRGLADAVHLSMVKRARRGEPEAPFAAGAGASADKGTAALPSIFALFKNWRSSFALW